MLIAIINGPNLNLLGKREPEIYGALPFENYMDILISENPKHKLEYYQSNVEGELINYIQDCGLRCDAILLNAGGYTHTSVAVADAVASISTPVIEVHVSHPLSREDYRHISIVGSRCKASVAGFGLFSYQLALFGLENLFITH